MPDLLIAAIARITDNAEILALLKDCTGLDASRITVFKTDHVHDVSPHLRAHSIPSDPAPAAFGSHGTNVPGMGTTLALNAYVADDADIDRFKGTGMPSDTAHYYNIAVDEGRSVVTYVTSTETATLVEDQFRACGFVKIRHFPVAAKFAVECGAERT